MHRLRMTTALVAVVAILGVLPGCASPAPEVSDGASGPVDACDLLTPDEVATALGVDPASLDEPTADVGGVDDPEQGASSCTWVTSPMAGLQGGRTGSAVLDVRWHPSASDAADRLETERSVYSDHEDVAIGDDALLVADAVHVVSGRRSFALTVLTSDASGRRNALETLGTAAVGRL